MVQYVGVGLRSVAAIIDTAILFVVGYIVASLTGGTTSAGFQLQGAPFFLWLVLALLYYIAMEATGGATIGKRLIGLKVATLEGESPVDWRASIVRNLLRLVDGIAFYLVGAILIWTSDKKQRLGDRIAGTVVLRA